jgi:hypothetical protein
MPLPYTRVWVIKTRKPRCAHATRALRNDGFLASFFDALLLAFFTTMEHSIGNDDDYGFPQEQQDASGATKYAILLTILCIGLIQFRGKKNFLARLMTAESLLVS